MPETGSVTRWHRNIAALGGGLMLAACRGPMSTLEPAGQGAADIAWITWVMIWGCLFFMIAMSALWLHAVRRRSEEPVRLSDRGILVWGGLVVPTLALLLLLVWGVRSGHSLLPIGEADLDIHVTAHQWWWQFEYTGPDGETLETVDELHLPAGAAIDIHVATADVIHSFWVPALGGKIDAIPGRVNSIRLRPQQAGQWRGQCAEFCGARHAHMAFEVTVHEPDDFQSWLEALAAESASSDNDDGTDR
jgi:cytochrome c oxidase subunit II